jgi:hypothetical protein
MSDDELIKEIQQLEKKFNKIIFCISEEDIALSILEPLFKSYVRDEHFNRQEVFANELASRLFSQQDFKEQLANELINLSSIRRWLIKNQYLFGEESND